MTGESSFALGGARGHAQPRLIACFTRNAAKQTGRDEIFRLIPGCTEPYRA